MIVVTAILVAKTVVKTETIIVFSTFDSLKTAIPTVRVPCRNIAFIITFTILEPGPTEPVHIYIYRCIGMFMSSSIQTLVSSERVNPFFRPSENKSIFLCFVHQKNTHKLIMKIRENSQFYH